MTYQVSDETLRKASTAAQREVTDAISQLSRSARGREAMKAVVGLIESHSGLDSRNKAAVASLLHWSEAFTGTVLDDLRAAVQA